MSEANPRSLDVFPAWLASLAADFRQMAELLNSTDLSEDSRLWIAAAVGYLFKSLDLIPDGVEDLGFLDDAFVLRVAARRAAGEAGESASQLDPLPRLSADVGVIEGFLGSEMDRLNDYVSGLSIVKVRGRTPADVVQDAGLTKQVVEEARSWCQSYVVPSFAPDEKNLIKLKSFLCTKLP